MPLELNVQFSIVLYSILAGLLTGALFDMYRIFRGENVPKVIVIIEDILFWILASSAIFTFLLYFNYAFLNPYVYLFIVLSLALYIKFVSPKVVKVEKVTLRGIGKGVRITCKLSIYPFKNMWSKFGNKSK